MMVEKSRFFFVFEAQLLLNVIGAVFININNDELFRRIGGNLTAQFRTDGAAAARYKHCFALDERADLFVVDLNRVTSQKLVHGEIAQLFHHAALRGIKIGKPRQHFDFDVDVLAVFENVRTLLVVGRGNGDDNQMDVMFFA